MPIIFLMFPARKSSPQDRPSWLDWLLFTLAFVPNLYSYIEANTINMRMENVDALSHGQLALGTLLVLLVLEALRRAVTPVLAGMVALGIAYLFLTEQMPGILQYRNMPFHEIVETAYLLNGMGIYGSITGISATMVATFIIFGAFIEGSGIGRLFHNVGMRVAGRYSGGPAKVEVISSSLFGTISGSSVANVYATGSFTIPAMIKLGYQRHFAAGVETAASVGGQIMPPVMGAGDRSEVLKDLHLLIPVAVLVGLMLMSYSPTFSCFCATVSLLPVSWLRRETRLYPHALLAMLINGGKNMAMVALACAGAGLFVAALTVTGMVISFSSVVTALAGKSLFISGLLLMVLTLVLGMGVPTTAAYIIGAAIGAPILVKLGVPVLAAHMFIFYFAILADATPPVSVASYAAASIAGADPMRTGLVAFRLSSAGFVVAFSYLYTPALLLQGPALDILAQLLVNLLGLTLVSAGLSGYFCGDRGMKVRVVIVVAGLGLVLAHGMPVWWRVAIEAALLAGLALLPPKAANTAKY